MEHHFDVEIAKEYGILEAILLNNIYFWLEHNIANEQNFYDGEYWTFNSIKAYSKLFPYVSERQITLALKNLEELQIIKTGNYNKNPYDRTKWYALTKLGYSIMQKCQMETSEMSNGNVKNVEPIPYNKPYIKKDIKTRVGATDVTPIPQQENESKISETKNDTDVIVDGTPLPPQTPPSPQEDLLDKVPKNKEEKKPKKKKTKVDKKEEWINRNMENIEVYGFSDQIKNGLERYFNYLADFGVLLPWDSLSMQMDKLATVSRSKQLMVIDKTIERGWKSLVYVVDRDIKEPENNSSYRIEGGENYRTKEERQAWFDKYKDVR